MLLCAVHASYGAAAAVVKFSGQRSNTDMSNATRQHNILGVTAVRQVLALAAGNTQDDPAILERLRNSCIKFDHSNNGMLSVDEYFNVLKLQHGIQIGKPELRVILASLPAKDGKIKIDDFFDAEVVTDETFKMIDRNKDGFITKAELKLAKKHVGMGDIDKCIKEHDANQDGKLDLDEYSRTAPKITVEEKVDPYKSISSNRKKAQERNQSKDKHHHDKSKTKK